MLCINKHQFHVLINLELNSFPDYDYFRDPEVQAQLTHILYVHSVMHPNIGYRQGMHELLAPLFHAVDYDSLPDNDQTDPDVTEFCSRSWVAADAWALFGVVMQGVSSWYEWREPAPPPIPAALQNQYRHGPPEGQLELKPYVAPIVLSCQRLQAQMLKATDPALWQGMQKAGVEPQIYGMLESDLCLNNLIKADIIVFVVAGYVYCLHESSTFPTP